MRTCQACDDICVHDKRLFVRDKRSTTYAFMRKGQPGDDIYVHENFSNCQNFELHRTIFQIGLGL
jgi:hypothetical protein